MGKEIFGSAKAEKETHTQFEAAKDRLYRFGAVDAMRAASELFPKKLTFRLIDNYGDKEAPSVVLEGAKKSQSKKDDQGKQITEITWEELAVSAMIYQPITFIVVTSRKIEKCQGEELSEPSFYHCWQREAYSKEQMIASIHDGVCEMVKLSKKERVSLDKVLPYTFKPMLKTGQ